MQLFVPPAFGSLPVYPGYLPGAGSYFTLGNRTYYVKGVQNPNDSTVAVNIPVLVGIKFADPADPSAANQRRLYYFDNTDSDTTRVVHAVNVYNTGDLDIGGSAANADPTQSVNVERVDQFSLFDYTTSGWESAGSLENRDQNVPYLNNILARYMPDSTDGEGDQNTPAHFLHAATHVARWYQSDGAGNIVSNDVFLDVEYIDQIKLSSIPNQGAGFTATVRGQMFKIVLANNWYSQFNGDGTFSMHNPQPAVAA